MCSTMPPFVEVPCKTLKELPRNVRGNILALVAANKKWSRLPGDVRNLVAHNMRRATPSALAMQEAVEDIPHTVFLFSEEGTMNQNRKA